MSSSPGSVRVVSLASVLLCGCGLRSDADFQQQCVDDSEDTEGESPIASCMNPVSLPLQPNLVQGVIGGCSAAAGYCGGSGGEDVYVFEPNVASDWTITFRPDLTDFDPILRVVQGEPCGDAPIDTTEVCADIVNEFPGRSFWADPVNGPIYVIVDAALGEGGQYGFEFRCCAAEVPTTCEEHVEEQPIVLGIGGNFQWSGSVEEGQGLIDGKCGGQGAEDIFRLTTNSAGSLGVQVTSAEFEPVVTLRPGCPASTEIACGVGSLQKDVGIGEWLLAIDTNGVVGGEYQLVVTLD